MRIEYKDKRLQQCAKDPRAAKRFLGTLALSFLMRIELIDKATSFEDLRFMLGKFHELTGNRQGQWSASLNANYRLILTPKDKPFMEYKGLFKPENNIIKVSDDNGKNWTDVLKITSLESGKNAVLSAEIVQPVNSVKSLQLKGSTE